MAQDHESWEVAKNLSPKRHKILMSIRTRGGIVQKSLITQDTELDSSLINHHLREMMAQNLVERTDTGPDGKVPQEGYTYQITDVGRDVLNEAQERYELTPIEERAVRRRFDDLEARVEKLEQENEQLRSILYDPHEKYDTLDEWVEAIRDNVLLLQEQWQNQDQG
jgi:DNA-binding MarR family transcriptional regulator